MCQRVSTAARHFFWPGTFTRFTRFLHYFTWFLRNFTWFLHDFTQFLRFFARHKFSAARQVMDEKGEEDMEVMIEVAMEVVLGSEMEGRREGGWDVGGGGCDNGEGCVKISELLSRKWKLLKKELWLVTSCLWRCLKVYLFLQDSFIELNAIWITIWVITYLERLLHGTVPWGKCSCNCGALGVL